MTGDQYSLSVVLVLTLLLFIQGRWRQDLVAWLMLMVATILGLVEADDVWKGLSHSAVVSVAAVLVLSKSLTSAGVVDWAAKPLERVASRPRLLLAGLTTITAVLSGFINNVGALALLMPVAIRLAKESSKPVSMYLMPLAFASLLGGMTTLIGTPPNLIVAGFRQQTGVRAFSMFDFASVGVIVAFAGVVFLTTIGWRLVPKRGARVSGAELFKIGPYLTEVKVPEKCPLAGKSVGDAASHEVQILSVVRGERRFAAPSAYLRLREGDVLVLMGAGEAIERFAKDKGLEVVQRADPQNEQAKKNEGGERGDPPAPPEELAESKEVGLGEAVVRPTSWIIGSFAASLRLRHRFGINLVGVAREGSRREPRLDSTRFQAGDVLLLQGPREDLPARIADLDCLPLAERPLAIGNATKRWRAVAVFSAGIFSVAVGFLPAPVAFVSAAVVMVLVRVIAVREAYDAIEWPVLSLLAAMIPLGLAIETTGLAQLIADRALWIAGFAPVWAVIAAILVVTMFLSDLVNNAAAAVLMCPIALGVAKGLNASADPFLIATAIGASCAFLTPVGHQSTLLVMGPGGYRFGDYWRCGIVLELLIAFVAVPGIMYFWPPR